MDFDALRHKMVQEQIACRGITDTKVLNALQKVPRDQFVPVDARSMAYQDTPISIGDGQTVSQPYMVALMTQCLELNKDKRILEIGTGSGYQTAILAELSKEVFSIERIGSLFERAKQRLESMGYQNVTLVQGDGTLGWPDTSILFDGIIITAASPGQVEPLLKQLAQGGCLVAPIGQRHSQTLTLFKKNKNSITEEPVCACTFVPLIGAQGWPA